MKKLNFNTKIAELTFSVVDTETSGMSARSGAALVEIAAVKIVPPMTLDLKNCYSSLIQQTAPISPETTAIHGITDDMVADAPSLQSVMTTYAEFVKGTIFVAHNAAFDCSFINKALSLCNIAPTVGHIFDTIAISRKLYPRLESHSLDSLINFHRIATPRTDGARHRALYDADHTAILLLIMLNELQALGADTLGDLYEFVG